MRGYRTEKESTFTSILITNVLMNYFHYLAVTLTGKARFLRKIVFFDDWVNFLRLTVLSNTDAARHDKKIIANSVCTCYTCLVSTYPALLLPGSHVGRARKIRLQTRNVAHKFVAEAKIFEILTRHFLLAFASGPSLIFLNTYSILSH